MKSIDAFLRRFSRLDRDIATYVSRRVTVDGDCIIWTSDMAHGYGVMNYKGKRALAHRFVWQTFNNRALTFAECVCHRCDNSRCVNPIHLFVGSRGENNRDSSAKGRRGRKLTPDQVREIRSLHSSGSAGYRPLARRFGVSFAMVRDIVKGKRWFISQEATSV